MFGSMRSKEGDTVSLPDMTLSFWCMVSAHRTCSISKGWGKAWASFRKLCGIPSFDMIFRRMYFFPSFFDDMRYGLYHHVGNLEKNCKKNVKVFHCTSQMIRQQSLSVFFIATFVHKQDIVFYKSAMPWLSFRHILW